jgi:hypothetical protein
VPLVPPTVSEYVPAAMLLVVEILSVAAPEVVIDAGVKPADIPDGNPLAVRDTVPANPLLPATFTVKLVLFPAPTVCEPGVAEIEKSGGAIGVTVILTAVVWFSDPLEPPMVSA